MVDAEDVAEATPRGPDPEPYLEQIARVRPGGLHHVYIHQVGATRRRSSSSRAELLI